VVKHFVVTLPSYIHNQLKEKCRFNDISMQEVTTSLLVRFIDGDFDKDFSINTFENEVPGDYESNTGPPYRSG